MGDRVIGIAPDAQTAFRLADGHVLISRLSISISARLTGPQIATELSRDKGMMSSS
jgi:hypothetical protein